MADYIPRRTDQTLLYQLICAHLETFKQSLSDQGQALPKHVQKEFAAYLRCGIHAYGFARLRCLGCRGESFLAFSCKKRGFCASCTAKKMAEVAAHLVDNILPETPYRQFVLSVPIPLRYWMATNRKLTSKVHKIFAEEVEALYQRKAESLGLQTVGSGSINFIQRTPVTDRRSSLVKLVRRYGSRDYLRLHPANFRRAAAGRSCSLGCLRSTSRSVAAAVVR